MNFLFRRHRTEIFYCFYSYFLILKLTKSFEFFFLKKEVGEGGGRKTVRKSDRNTLRDPDKFFQ